MGTLRVRDLMTEKVYSVKPNSSLAELYDLMETLKVRHVPVVKDGEVLGLVSHRDLIQGALLNNQLPLSSQQDLLQKTRVEEVMVTEVETIDPDEEVAEAGRIMLDNKFGCLPVVEGTELVGIITESDFIRRVVDEESKAAA